MTAALTIRRIASREERLILLRYAQGHDTLRIAAGVGRGTETIAHTIGAVCGFDRGRAAQAVRAYDAAHPQRPTSQAPAPNPAGRDPRIAELEAQIRGLRDRLTTVTQQADTAQRQTLTELRDTRKLLADTHLKLTTARDAAKATQLELARANRQLKIRESKLATATEQLEQRLADLKTPNRVAHLENALVTAETRFAAELKQLGEHLTHADDIANTYKARLDRLHELTGWASEGNGALITIAAVRQALNGEEPS